MSDLSLSRSGYANQRSPSALAAAIAINGGVIALLIAIPVTIDKLPEFERLVTHNIRYVPPPPPRPEPRKPEPARKTVQKVIDHTPPIADQRHVDPIVRFGGSTQTAADDFAGIDTSGTGTIIAADPPKPVVFVKARPDPRFAEAFHPDYPPAMRREGLEGAVTVRVTIDERGRVIAVEQVSASNPIFFEETRRQALRSWRFVPAKRDGVAIQSEQTMTVRFRLES
jgi:protein TonB